jgi:acid phosphatase family membrane protein YuiD
MCALELSDNKERQKQVIDAASGKTLTDIEIEGMSSSWSSLSSSVSVSFNPETTFATSSFIVSDFATDYVFRDKDFVPIEIAEKRIAKLRKLHPEYFEPLERMKEKAYKETEQENIFQRLLKK